MTKGIFGKVVIAIVVVVVIVNVLKAVGTDLLTLVGFGLIVAAVLVGSQAMKPRATLRRSLQGEQIRVEFADDQDDDDPPIVWGPRVYIDGDDVLDLLRKAAAGSERLPTSVDTSSPIYKWLTEATFKDAEVKVRNAVTARLILSNYEAGGEELLLEAICHPTSDGTLVRVVRLRLES